MMTFKRFQKSVRMLDSTLSADKIEMEKITGSKPYDDEPEYLFVYDGNCFINAELDADDNFKYYLCLCNEEWGDADRSKRERILYDDHYATWFADRECYDCKDEYETPLVKKGDKYLCKDCLMMRDLQKEFADSPFALIVK